MRTRSRPSRSCSTRWKRPSPKAERSSELTKTRRSFRGTDVTASDRPAAQVALVRKAVVRQLVGRHHLQWPRIGPHPRVGRAVAAIVDSAARNAAPQRILLIHHQSFPVEFSAAAGVVARPAGNPPCRVVVIHIPPGFGG